MSANAAEGNRVLSGNTTYTFAGSASVKLHMIWALRNIHR